MARKMAWIAAGVAGLLAVGAATTASATAGESPAAAAPRWHIIKSVRTNSGGFTAVVATGKTTAWAFSGNAPASGPTAWAENHGTWTKVAFPGRSDETVTSAGATSPSDVWAFTDNIFDSESRVLRWTGSKWSVVRTFGAPIGGSAVLGSKDVWVFGGAYPSGLGVWHYDGRGWTQVSKTLDGGSVLSAASVWAYGGTSVDHWDGSKWTSTSVQNLLPAKQELNDPQVTGILALSASNVYAIGNGNAEDEGGPFAVLHYNGHKWSRLAEGGYGYGTGQQISADGSGGLWLPMPGASGARPYMLHYAAGKLTMITLPDSATVWTVARIPGTTQQLAGGFVFAANHSGIIAEVLLRYS